MTKHKKKRQNIKSVVMKSGISQRKVSLSSKRCKQYAYKQAGKKDIYLAMVHFFH